MNFCQQRQHDAEQECSLTPVVQLLKQTGGEQGPSRCCELGARAMSARGAQQMHGGCTGWHYLWSMCRFEDISAARLAVGDEPRMGPRVK